MAPWSGNSISHLLCKSPKSNLSFIFLTTKITLCQMKIWGAINSINISHLDFTVNSEKGIFTWDFTFVPCALHWTERDNTFRPFGSQMHETKSQFCPFHSCKTRSVQKFLRVVKGEPPVENCMQLYKYGWRRCTVFKILMTCKFQRKIDV